MKGVVTRKQVVGICLVLPSFVGVAIFYLLPFFQSFFYALTKGTINRKFVGIENFVRLLSNEAYLLAVKNTAMIVGCAVPCLMLLSLGVAMVMSKYKGRHRTAWLMSLLLIPLVIPSASLTLFWKDMLDRHGLINSLFNTSIDWLYSDYAGGVISLLIIWKNLGYNICLLMAALLTMPKEYEEVADLNGATRLQQAKYVVIPYLKPVLFFVGIVSLLNSFKIFREVYLLQGDYPSKQLYMLQHFMNNHFKNLNYEMLTASAFLLYIMMFGLIYWCMKRQV